MPDCAHNTSQHQQKAQTHKFYGCYADPEADCRHPFICWTWIIQQKLPDFAVWHVEASRLQSNTSCKLIKWLNCTQLSLQAWQVLPHQKDAPPLHSGYTTLGNVQLAAEVWNFYWTCTILTMTHDYYSSFSRRVCFYLFGQGCTTNVLLGLWCISHKFLRLSSQLQLSIQLLALHTMKNTPDRVAR